jgi:putative ABC transport system ATP-binding protein
MTAIAVVCEGLSHHYGQGRLRRQVLFDLSLKVGQGEIVILTGPSGSGKTTLLSLCGGLRTVQKGQLTILDNDISRASEKELYQVRRRMGFIFQAHNLHRSLSAVQNVAMGLEVRQPLSRQERERHALLMLEHIGMADHGHKYPEELSGGQKQRVAIARALVHQPKLVLADEPTAALDKHTGREVVDLMSTLAHEHGTTIILVTHDNRILDVADRILNMEDGRLI